MNKKIIGGAVVAVAVVGVVFFFLSRQPEEQIATEKVEVRTEQKAEGYRGQLDYVEGAVEKRASEADGWRTAERGDVLGSGMEIRTLADAKAVLTFEDGSVARLDENTQIKLVTDQNAITLQMPSGTVFNRVAKKADRQYTVDTGSYNMRALGTVFSVSNNKGDNPELIVLESQVEMKKGDAADTAQAGEKIALNNDKLEKKKFEQKDLEKKFIAWNIKEDKMEVKIAAEKKTEPKTETEESTSQKIVLSGKKSDEGVKLSWEAQNLGSFDGFKVVKSKEVNPVYPGDYQYLAGNSARAYIWKLQDGNKYHFRVCKYVGGKCAFYSNDVLVEAPEGKGDGDFASAITLKASKGDDKTKLSWSISGGEAPKGFKIMKSKEKNPVFEDGYYQYISDPDERSFSFSNFSDVKYHFRVCVYKGGSCGAYSNDVEVSF